MKHSQATSATLDPAIASERCAREGTVRSFVAWSSLALVAQACSLALIDQGTRLHYQHYRPFSEILSLHPLPLTLLAMQALAVGVSISRRWSDITGWMRRHLSSWQLVLLSSLFLLTPATLSREPARYVEELLFSSALQTVQLGNFVLIVMAVPAGLANWIGGIATAWTSERNALRVVLLAAAWTIVVTGVLAFFVYERHPHLQDEVAYYLQASMFSHGTIRAPALPVPEAFGLYLVESSPSSLYAATLPGWPAVLALGFLAGVPWLVNPLLAGLSVLVLYLLIREVCGISAGVGVALLFALSPWQIFLSMSFMTHTLTLLLGMAGTLLIIRGLSNGSQTSIFIAGALSALAVAVRPLDGGLIGLFLGFIVITTGTCGMRLKRIVAMGAGATLPLLALLTYNQAITGAPALFPLNDYIDRHFGKGVNDFGFGPNRGFGWALDPFPGHSPLDAMVNANLNISTINFDLLGWGMGSLLAVGLIALRHWQELGRTELAALALISGVVITHSFYYFSGGPDFGARYWYLLLPALLVLAVRGMQALMEQLKSRHAALLASIAVLCVAANLTVAPWRALEKYYGYLGMHPDARTLVEQRHVGKALVLVRGAAFPDYASAAAYNPFGSSENRPLFAHESTPEIAERLVHALAGRQMWILEGTTLHQGRARLLGPFPVGRVPR